MFHLPGADDLDVYNLRSIRELGLVFYVDISTTDCNTTGIPKVSLTTIAAKIGCKNCRILCSNLVKTGAKATWP